MSASHRNEGPTIVVGTGPGTAPLRIEDVGAIASGDTREIPLTVSIDEPGELLAAGTNVLHVDTDSAVLGDPYAQLKAPPRATHSAPLPCTFPLGALLTLRAPCAAQAACRSWC